MKLESKTLAELGSEYFLHLFLGIYIERERINLLQWCVLENQQSPFYVVNKDCLSQDYIP